MSHLGNSSILACLARALAVRVTILKSYCRVYVFTAR